MYCPQCIVKDKTVLLHVVQALRRGRGELYRYSISVLDGVGVKSQSWLIYPWERGFVQIIQEPWDLGLVCMDPEILPLQQSLNHRPPSL